MQVCTYHAYVSPEILTQSSTHFPIIPAHRAGVFWWAKYYPILTYCRQMPKGERRSLNAIQCRLIKNSLRGNRLPFIFKLFFRQLIGCIENV